MCQSLMALVSHSAKTRQAALEGLRGALASKLLSEFLLERRMTLTDSIERCLKKGTVLPPPGPAQPWAPWSGARSNPDSLEAPVVCVGTAWSSGAGGRRALVSDQRWLLSGGRRLGSWVRC